MVYKNCRGTVHRIQATGQREVLFDLPVTPPFGWSFQEVPDQLGNKDECAPDHPG